MIKHSSTCMHKKYITNNFLSFGVILGHPFSFHLAYCLTDPNFWHFQYFFFIKTKSKDVVKPFFTSNTSFNLKNEHSNSIEKNKNKNRNIFLHYIVYFVNPNM